MNIKFKKVISVILGFTICFNLSGFIYKGQNSTNATNPTENINKFDVSTISIEEIKVPLSKKTELSSILVPVSSGITTYGNAKVKIDASNISQGYVMIKYLGKNKKIKVQISNDNKNIYTYELNSRDIYGVFPLSEGNGKYSISIFENIKGTSYCQAYAKTIDVKLKDEFLPFLYPNQYVNFNKDCKAVKLSNELTKDANSDIDALNDIYEYVVKNISYDDEKAKRVKSGYIPNVDETLNTKKGICFDYASLMTSMLRANNIPTKLVIGYTGDVYHAWITTYLKDKGWVDNVIYFDGTTWKIMDPTFASTGKSSKQVMDYISNAKNYKQKYVY